MLTGTQIAVCRELLAEHKAKQVDSSRGTKSGRGSIQRYWGGIPEPWHDAVLEFLSKYVAASNMEVVRIADGDTPCSVPGVLGDYVFNYTYANGQPVRTNGEFFLKAVHYEINSNQWRWAIVDNNNMILLLTDLTDDYIAHWVDPDAGFFDEWGFTDESGIVEPSTPLPDVPEFLGQTMTMTAAEDHLMVNEYGWIVEDEAATYTVTGDIVLSSVASEDAVYGLVLNPLVDGHVRQGSWSGGDCKMVKTDGKQNANEGDWMVVQELWFEPSTYLLVGRKITDRITEDTRLYTGIAEGEVSDKVADLAQLESYAVVESNARQTSRTGVFDVYVTVLTVNTGGSYIVIGKEGTEYTSEETRLYPYVKESDVSALINSLAVLGDYSLVSSSARKTKYEGVYDVHLTVLALTMPDNAIKVGSKTPGFIRRDVYLVPNVPDSEISAIVDTLAAQALIENVHSTRTRNRGFRDLFYTQIVLPAAQTTVEVAFDAKEGDWGASAWKFITNYVPQRNSDGDVVDHESYRQALPIGHGEYALVRKVTVTTIKTYSATEPGTPAGSAVATGVDTTATFNINGARKYQMPNGLWVSETISTVKLAWGTSG